MNMFRNFQEHLIYAHVRKDNLKRKALRKFMLCDVRNKHCWIEKILRSCSYKLITEN